MWSSVLLADSKRIDFDHTDCNKKEIVRDSEGYISQVIEHFDDAKVITTIKYINGHWVNSYETYKRYQE